MNSIWAFNSWHAFFSMGGHGLYVWASYSAFVILLLLLVGLSFFQLKSWQKKELKRLQRMQHQTAQQQSVGQTRI